MSEERNAASDEIINKTTDTGIENISFKKKIRRNLRQRIKAENSDDSEDDHVG